MKNKTLVIIVIGAVIALAAVAYLVVLLHKKPTTQTTTTTNPPSTGTGTVSNGASPDLALVGSGTVVVDTPKVDATQPFATTAPRVEPPAQTSGTGVALQPANGSSQATSTDTNGQVALNYNQSDDSFLNAYYPDASQVILGQEGPNGNVGQDPSNQVLYVTPTAQTSGPPLTLPDGANTSSIPTSSDNSVQAIFNYLKALAAATAPFDIVNNTSLVTQPLQALDPNAATTAGIQASAVLQSIAALKVPSSIVDLQASYLSAYEEYVTYSSQLSAFLNSGTSGLSAQGAAVQNTVTTISTVLGDASTNYKNVVAYYGLGTGQ